MFCEKCGTKVKEDAVFCQNCGTSFLNNQHIQAPIIPTENRSSWTMGRIVKGVLIAAVVVVGIILKITTSINNEAVSKNNSALTSYSSGSSEQAISQFQQASNDAIDNDTKRGTLINLAYVYASDSKNDLALKTFREALTLASGESFDYYLISGEIGLLENKPAIALSNYNKAYQIKSNDFQINNALNLFYLDLEDNAKAYANYSKALGYAQKAYEVSDETIKDIAKENLAIAYLLNKKYDQALSLLLSIDSTKKPYNNYWIGLTYLGKEDVTNAKIYFQKAKNAGITIEPEISKYLY